MDIKAFMLTNKDDADQVFAVGISIVGEDGDEEAVIYRRGASDQSLLAVVSSPEAACRRFSSTFAPMEVVWVADEHRGRSTAVPGRGCGGFLPRHR